MSVYLTKQQAIELEEWNKNQQAHVLLAGNKTYPIWRRNPTDVNRLILPESRAAINELETYLLEHNAPAFILEKIDEHKQYRGSR